MVLPCSSLRVITFLACVWTLLCLYGCAVGAAMLALLFDVYM